MSDNKSNVNSEEMMMQDETARVVREQIIALPDKLKQPILLHYYEKMTLEEVGRVAGCSVQGAHKRIRKAIAVLREKLTTCGYAAVVPQLSGILQSLQPLQAPESITAAIKEMRPRFHDIPKQPSLLQQGGADMISKLLLTGVLVTGVGAGVVVSNLSQDDAPEKPGVSDVDDQVKKEVRLLKENNKVLVKANTGLKEEVKDQGERISYLENELAALKEVLLKTTTEIQSEKEEQNLKELQGKVLQLLGTIAEHQGWYRRNAIGNEQEKFASDLETLVNARYMGEEGEVITPEFGEDFIDEWKTGEKTGYVYEFLLNGKDGNPFDGNGYGLFARPITYGGETKDSLYIGSNTEGFFVKDFGGSFPLPQAPADLKSEGWKRYRKNR